MITRPPMMLTEITAAKFSDPLPDFPVVEVLVVAVVIVVAVVRVTVGEGGDGVRGEEVGLTVVGAGVGGAVDDVGPGEAVGPTVLIVACVSSRMTTSSGVGYLPSQASVKASPAT